MKNHSFVGFQYCTQTIISIYNYLRYKKYNLVCEQILSCLRKYFATVTWGLLATQSAATAISPGLSSLSDGVKLCFGGKCGVPFRHFTKAPGPLTPRAWTVGRLQADLLKVIFCAWSEFTFKKLCAELCAEIAKKKIIFEKTGSNWAENMKKCLFCKFCIQKLKFCADSRKLCADICPRVRAF